MKKYIISVILIILVILFSFIFTERDNEPNYPTLTVDVDTMKSTEFCESDIEYTINGSGYFNIGFIGYKLEKKVFLGWKEVDIVSMAYTMPLRRYPFVSSICTPNELESGTYRITTIMRDSSTVDPLKETFTIDKE